MTDSRSAAAAYGLEPGLCRKRVTACFAASKTAQYLLLRAQLRHAGESLTPSRSATMARPFTAAVQKDNFYGVQFHPERSGAAGAQLLKNFLEM